MSPLAEEGSLTDGIYPHYGVVMDYHPQMAVFLSGNTVQLIGNII
jgi:hypothetical protein